MTMVSMVGQNSAMTCAASLHHSSQSTASSGRAMKLSRLFAPPKVTWRMMSVSSCQLPAASIGHRSSVIG
jgi:hypothetical protein